MNVTMLIVVLIFILLDLIIGLVKALATSTYKSLKMREGLWHKLGEILCVAFGALCEMAFPYVGITVSIPIVTTICVYIVLMETGSIVENLMVISPDIKNVMSKVFGTYKPNDSEDEQEGN